MTRHPTLAGLYALRAQVDALIIAEEAGAESPGPDPGVCPKCGLDEDQLINASTMDGTNARQCPRCGERWVLR